MATLNEIQKFLAPRKMAIAGASRNVQKFGGSVFKELLENGFELYPVNPNADEILGVKCYKSVDDLPPDVEYLYIVTPKYETELVANAAVRKAMKMVWIQRQSDTPNAILTIEKAGIPLVYDKCIMMFAEPVRGAHRFHRLLAKVFGGYPKLKLSTN
ncbi:CoA-binding protein [Draconibacterium sp.]|jgi:predicted CoA-binding protein